jgi:hypothetical protein
MVAFMLRYSLTICVVRAGMSLKRKAGTNRLLGAAALTPSSLGRGGSRFVSCPICGTSVAFQLINTHLDTDCVSRSKRARVSKELASGTASAAELVQPLQTSAQSDTEGT